MNGELFGVPSQVQTGMFITEWTPLSSFSTAGKAYEFRHPYGTMPTLVRTLYRNKGAEQIYVPGMVIQDIPFRYVGGRSFQTTLQPYKLIARLANGEGATNFQFRTSVSGTQYAANTALWEVAFMVIE